MATSSLTGLALPAVKRSGSNYFDSKTNAKVAWGDLLISLIVPAGTRPLSRSFGSSIHRYVFEPNDSRTQTMIRYIIEQAAAKYAPMVKISNVAITSSGQTLNFVITFRMANDPTLMEDSVSFPQSVFFPTTR
jgi:phage baseplate assembly protein W